MLKYFHEIYKEVAEYLMTKGQFDTEVIQVNSKGDQTKGFDYNTEEMILNYFEKHLPCPVRVMTEERGEMSLGSGSPEYTIIIDPVDGSENFLRRLGVTGFSVAAIPAGEALTIDNVQYAFVGHVYMNKVFTCEKDKGAFCNGEKLSSSRQTDLHKAVVTAYILGKRKEDFENMIPLLRQLTSMRCFGSAAYEVCLVASAGLDSYIDVRGRLTPENFIAAAMMLQEAGGIVTDTSGNALAPIEKLSTGYKFVASGNRKIHEAILKYLP